MGLSGMPASSKFVKAGRKDDGGKADFSQLEWDVIDEMIKVLMEGAKTYGDRNWQNVENLTKRYSNAALRHITAYQKGERIDPQYGKSHMAHAMCCCMFCLWKEQQERKDAGHGTAPKAN